VINENDFVLSETKKDDICRYLPSRQKQRALTRMRLQETLNRGDFDAMDGFFDADFTYGNPSRPDLGSYASWKTCRRIPTSNSANVSGDGL
jgi:hypothetical protein